MSGTVLETIPSHILWPTFGAFVGEHRMLVTYAALAVVFSAAVFITMRRSRGWRVIILVLTMAVLHPVSCTTGLMYKAELVSEWEGHVDNRTLVGEPLLRLQSAVNSLSSNETYYRFGWYFVLMQFLFCFLAIYAVKIPYRILRWGWRRWRAPLDDPDVA